jgi:hypothetical protein
VSKIFTVIIDEEVLVDMEIQLFARGEIDPGIIRKMESKDILENSIPFPITYIEEEES